MAQNRAAFLLEAGQPLSIRDAEMPRAGEHEIVVKNAALAVNPIDVKQQQSGFFVKSFPHVLGHDVAGEVYEVGSAVSTFQKGDRVVGHPWSMLTGKAQDGGFALYTKVPASNAAKLPSSMAFTDAVVLPLGLDTAIGGLYEPGPLALPFPSTKPEASGKVIVVYGGSSSVGISVIQLAAASGVRSIAIASPHNHELCKSAGASDVFDYKDANFVADVVGAVKGDEFVGLYDAIADESTFPHTFDIMEKLGGGAMAYTHKPEGELPSNVNGKFVFGIGSFAFPIWEKFVGEALENGQLKCLPRPLVVGKGLESLNAGLEKQAAGVSAQKIVIEL